jgi:hypothetical protein
LLIAMSEATDDAERTLDGAAVEGSERIWMMLARKMLDEVARRLGVFLVVAAAGAGCASGNLRYETAKIKPTRGAVPGRVVMCDPLDARDNGRPSARPTYKDGNAENEMKDLRQSFREHVVRAGFVASPAEVLPAPSSAVLLDDVLKGAAAKNAGEVIFVRFLGAGNSQRYVPGTALYMLGLVPGLIFDSLPVSRQGGTAAVEALAIDPRTRELLARSTHLVAHGEHSSNWRYSPDSLLKEMLRQAIDHTLADLVAARDSGYPERAAVPDVGQLVLAEPFTRIDGGRVAGPGFSLKVPDGWKSNTVTSRYDTSPVAELASPDGTLVKVGWEWTWASAEEYPEAVVKVLSAQKVALRAQRPVSIGRRQGLDIELVDAKQNAVLERVLGVGGIGFFVTCAGPATAFEKMRPACEDVFSSLQIAADQGAF